MFNFINDIIMNRLFFLEIYELNLILYVILKYICIIL